MTANQQLTVNQQRRKASLDCYLSNPNFCRECGKLISIPDGIKVSLIRVKQFCNRSCANTFNNRLHPKRRKRGLTQKKKINRIKGSRCIRCDSLTFSRDGRRKFCENCFKLYRFPNGVPFPEITKGELFSRRSNWQSARTSIRNHAQRIFSQSGLPAQCIVCKYSVHIEIAHRRPVKDFPDTAMIKEINALSNLIPLCPNHHWEHDHGLLVLGFQEAKEVTPDKQEIEVN